MLAGVEFFQFTNLHSTVGKRFNVGVVDELVLLQRPFVIDVVVEENLDGTGVEAVTAGNFVADALVSADVIRIVEFFKAFGQRITAEQSEVAELDLLVRYEPVVGAVA